MKKVFVVLVATFLAILGITQPAFAATPTVTKAYSTYLGTTYTVAVDGPVALVNAGPLNRDRDPSASGGCKVNFVRTRRGHTINGETCTGPGTITFYAASYQPCGTNFNVTFDGAQVYSDALTGACPPPAPPSIVVTNDVGTSTFYNPAAVQQETYYERSIPSLSSVITADGPMDYTTATRFAASGPNHYVYYVAILHVTLTAGQTTVVTIS